MEATQEDRSRASSGFQRRRNRPADVLWDGDAIVVDMGASRWHPWAGSTIPIGTFGLCGCTSLVVANDMGAIVAHIIPNLQNIDAELGHIRDLFITHFGPVIQGATCAARAMLFSPELLGLEVLPVLSNYVATFLAERLHLTVQTEPHTINFDESDPGEGTILVHLVDQQINVWLNNELIS